MNGPSGRTIIQASTLSMRSTSTGSPVVFASTPPVLSRLRHTTGGFRVEAARAFRASACSRMTLVCSLASASCSAASRLASSASARARLDRFFITVKETAVCHSDGHTTVSRTPKVTGRGQQYFIERFLDGRLTPDLADDEGAAA